MLERSERLALRIAPEEMDALKTLADLEGLSASDIVRKLIRKEFESQTGAPIKAKRATKGKRK